MMFRIGHGYDVHKYCANLKPLIVGGVNIEYDRGVDAHSDGDVLLHALCDAMLGALSQRDIGYHFPDSSNENKDRCSSDFVNYAKMLMCEQGYSIGNVDITIVAQAPKFKGYIVQIIETLATLLEIERDQVNVKATTTEKLGFIGREEGIGAHAVVLLMRECNKIGDKI